MSILQARYIITMPDGSKWQVPVSVIATNRAEYFSRRDGTSFVAALDDDTEPLFELDHDEIADWAQNNMDWADVEKFATPVERPPETDMQKGWTSGDWEIVK